MGQCSRQALCIKERKAEQDVGDLADGRIGQPFFEDILPQCHCRPHYDGHTDQGKVHPLYPAAPDGLRSGGIVDGADNTQYARLVITPDSTAEAGAGATG